MFRGSGGGLASATKPVRMRVSLVYIGIIVGMVAFIVAITLVGLRVARSRREELERRLGMRG